jgi:hypothetical protein
VPIVDRVHDHLHNHHGEWIPQRWQFTELGDVRAQARWQSEFGADDPMRARFVGATFGMKLPTGRHDVANSDGEVAERTLQPGTGTTDALVGAYYREALM